MRRLTLLIGRRFSGWLASQCCQNDNHDDEQQQGAQDHGQRTGSCLAAHLGGKLAHWYLAATRTFERAEGAIKKRADQPASHSGGCAAPSLHGFVATGTTV